MELYLNTRTFEITSEVGDKYTVETAKRLVDRGLVKDCNIAFRRLIENDFSMEAVRAQYKAMEAKS